ETGNGMTEAMPFLRKPILLSYDPRPCGRGAFPVAAARGIRSLPFRARYAKIDKNGWARGLVRMSGAHAAAGRRLPTAKKTGGVS
ncbi:hypothetical protein WMO64_15815, partial [Pseudoflavonifractor sp. CLA-AP-H29]